VIVPWAILAVSAALLAWVYLGYPVAVAIAARIRPARLTAEGPLPTVSVAIAAHNEAAVIGARVADALAQAGPGVNLAEVLVASDGSTDATDEIVATIAAGDPRVRLLPLARSGQTPAQHAMFEAARGDIVILTDAETRFAPGALAALVAPFRDPRVGATTGRLEWRDEQATATSRNEGLYWRYERRVRELESRAGWLTAVTGAFLAVRRASYRPVPASASMDHLLPLYVRELGQRVVYVPAAVATDRPISGLREQFRNRTRTATRGIRSNLSMARRLAPWRRPSAALAIWSHKLLRWWTPVFLLLATVSATIIAAGGVPWAWLAPAGVAAWLLAAGVAHLLIGARRQPPRLLAFARAFAVVNAAFLLASWNVLRGQRIETWRRAEWEAAGRKAAGH
jgi:cellulose synthase/poly-beta-1,6-N-acetylglucosamine synthase-like glycosyltransferase